MLWLPSFFDQNPPQEKCETNRLVGRSRLVEVWVHSRLSFLNSLCLNMGYTLTISCGIWSWNSSNPVEIWVCSIFKQAVVSVFDIPFDIGMRNATCEPLTSFLRSATAAVESVNQMMLVGGRALPSKKRWSSSVGMIIPFPTEWKNNPNVPNHQPATIHCRSLTLKLPHVRLLAFIDLKN